MIASHPLDESTGPVNQHKTAQNITIASPTRQTTKMITNTKGRSHIYFQKHKFRRTECSEINRNASQPLSSEMWSSVLPKKSTLK